MLSCVCLFLPDSHHTDLENVSAQKGEGFTEVNVIQDVQDVKLKQSAVILLLDGRKWDQTQSLCLMKTDPLCFGLLKEKKKKT